MSKGKLIVLEGIDGSGKSTNYKLLCDRLTENGVDYHSIVFPRYDQESSALIRMYLNGEFGSRPDDVNAYTASTFFSVDRFASYKSDWGALYEKGAVIIHLSTRGMQFQSLVWEDSTCFRATEPMSPSY